MIELKNVDKIYGKGDGAVHALKNVSVTIEDGKFTAILGKSGSGKSTLMNIIGALDSPTNGTVYANGQNLTEMSPNALAEYRNKTTGFVFQSFYLEPTFSVLDNVAMPLIIAGMPRKEREEKAIKVLTQLGLEDKINKKANELSGGQKQRVSIARALVHNPDIVLADEPTGNLDSQNGAEVMALLRDICNMGKSVVLVTHNMEDAKNADNIIFIEDGVAEMKSGNAVNSEANG
ncbi:MAG: ABC transporter ATP-binding protein [Clostridia bacterium]|nr:ABC transporter ATP-binding protein [Clostridia bacterium]